MSMPELPAPAWDFYLLPIDGRPAATRFDAALEAYAPVPQLDCLLAVSFQILEPGAQGIGTEREAARLAQLESLLARHLSHVARWVGTIRTAGDWRSLLYAIPGTDYASLIEAFMLQEAPAQPFFLDVEQDPTWRTYQNHLVPPHEARIWALTKRTSEALRARGDALTQPRIIEHMIAVDKATDAAAVSRAAEQLGFRTSKVSAKDLLLTREDSAISEQVYEAALALHRIAAAHDARYLGWESPVVQA